MFEAYEQLAQRALRNEPPSQRDCLWILDDPGVELLPLLHAAYQPRAHHFGRKVMVHVLNNVQNGLCPEDCGYCSQSRDSSSAIRKYPMKSEADILKEAEHAARSGATRYATAVSRSALKRIYEVVRTTRGNVQRNLIFVSFLLQGLLVAPHTIRKICRPSPTSLSLL